MSRVLRVRGVGEEKRGLLDFDVYEDWRGRERSEFDLLLLNGEVERKKVVLASVGFESTRADLVFVRFLPSAASYPPTHFYAFTAAAGPHLQPMIVDLFGLFSRLTAHSHLGGCVSTFLLSSRR